MSIESNGNGFIIWIIYLAWTKLITIVPAQFSMHETNQNSVDSLISNAFSMSLLIVAPHQFLFAKLQSVIGHAHLFVYYFFP